MLRLASADELVSAPLFGIMPIRKLFPTWDSMSVDFLAQCLRMDPDLRPKCSTLLQHMFFTQNNFAEKFLVELQKCIAKESAANTLITRRSEDERRLSPSTIESSSKTFRKSAVRSEFKALFLFWDLVRRIFSFLKGHKSLVKQPQ